VQFAHYLKFRDLFFIFFMLELIILNYEMGQARAEYSSSGSTKMVELELELGQYIFLHEPVPDRQYPLRIGSFTPIIDELLKIEDVKWKQRAKQSWYKSGDRNTKYFHSWANQRRNTNSIQRICDEQGTVWKKKADIRQVCVDYFAHLYTTQGLVRVQECLANVKARVNDDLNGQLLRPFIEKEVHEALSQIHHLKSPGPDRYNAGFYQKSWHITGKELVRQQYIFSMGGILMGLSILLILF
jgi:hypothetical protein